MKIAVILPAREGFSPDAFGAVSLCVRDFTLHSRYRSNTQVIGTRTESSFDGIHYSALTPTRGWFESATRAYIRSIREHLASLKPRLIEVHNRPNIARELAKESIPVALHLHNDPQEMKYAHTPAQRQKLLQQCAAIYCISDWVKHRFCEGVHNGLERVHTLPIGIAPPESLLLKEKLILYVGRMTPNKGALEYAQALAELLPRHPDWKGMMIGGRRHSVSQELSGYEQQIVQAMEQAGKQAHYAGFCTHDVTMQAMAKAAIVVIPSIWAEPFGRTAIEGLAHGCAVITSGSGGLREIIGEDGLILPEVTPSTIAATLDMLITNPQHMEILQQKGRERAALFTIDACSARLDAVRDALLTHQKDAA